GTNIAKAWHCGTMCHQARGEFADVLTSHGATFEGEKMHGFESTRDFVSQGIVAAILIGVFALLAADRVHRVLIPIGAVAVIWLISYFTPFRLISFEASKEAVDLNVILLLFAMMALVGVLKTTNVFPWLVDRLLERSRGNPSRSAALIIWFTGIL